MLGALGPAPLPKRQVLLACPADILCPAGEVGAPRGVDEVEGAEGGCWAGPGAEGVRVKGGGGLVVFVVWVVFGGWVEGVDFVVRGLLRVAVLEEGEVEGVERHRACGWSFYPAEGRGGGFGDGVAGVRGL